MQSIGQDLRGAVKALIVGPASSLTAILALALAIGANTAIFSVVRKPLTRRCYERFDRSF